MNNTERLARRIVSIAAHRPGMLVFLLSLAYFGAAFVLASNKIFWNDELFTYYLSRRPAFADVWAALLTGAEQLPPLFYLITRAFAGVFGFGYVALRLPEIIGFWVMAICLYRFVSRRTTKLYGVVAMIFPLATESLSYSVEARPYGLVLGFSGAALVFWQEASGLKYRPMSLVAMSLSLAAAVSCHYYGILVFLPFALGEAVRFGIRRKLDLAMAAALLAGVAPLAIYLPLIRAARGFSGTFWAKPQWASIVAFYQYLLYPALLLLLSIPVLLAAGDWLRVRHGEPDDARNPKLPLWEVATAAGFALIPIIAVFLAKTITGAFTNRYALPAVLGIAILLSWSIAILGRNRVGIALAVAGIATLSFLITAARIFQYNVGYAAEVRAELHSVEAISKNGTAQVIVANPHRFFELSYLLGEQGHSSIVYLADRDLALLHTGTDDVDLGLMHLKAWAPLHVEPFRNFLERRQDFTVIDDGQPFAWAVHQLTRKGWHIVLAGNVGAASILKVSPPEFHETGKSADTNLSPPIGSGRE